MIVTSLIPLSQGKFTIVDTEDFEYLNQWKWYLSHYGYAVTTWREGSGKDAVYRKIYMHRLLMKTPEDMETDHINRTPLDNRKSNLRNCSHQQNQSNRAKQVNNTSGYKGVVWHKQQQKWWARVTFKGKQISLGLHNTAEEAAKAYDKGAQLHHGEYVLTNGVKM